MVGNEMCYCASNVYKRSISGRFHHLLPNVVVICVRRLFCRGITSPNVINNKLKVMIYLFVLYYGGRLFDEVEQGGKLTHFQDYLHFMFVYLGGREAMYMCYVFVYVFNSKLYWFIAEMFTTRTIHIRSHNMPINCSHVILNCLFYVGLLIFSRSLEIN